MSRRLILMMTFCLLAVGVQAQNPDESYDARFVRLSRAYARNPRGVENAYQLSLFYFDNSNPLRNLPLAMRYVAIAEDQHVDLLQRNRVSDLVKLQRNGITLVTIRDLRMAIADAAAESVKLRTDLTMAEIDSYLETFGENEELAKLLRSRRYKLIFADVLAHGNADACYDFITTYSGTSEADQLDERLGRMMAAVMDTLPTQAAVDQLVSRYPQSTSVARVAARCKARLAFAEADDLGSIEAYNAFLAQYPASDESEVARERADHLLELDLAKRQTAMELAHFADSNADQLISEQALARLRHLIYATQDAAAAQYYVDHFKLDAFYSEVYSRYYSWHAVEGNAAPLERFAASNPNFPYPRAIEDDLEKATEIDAVPLMGRFRETDYDRYASYIRHMMGKAIAIVPLQRMLQGLVEEDRFEDAIFRTEQFEICFDNQWQYQYDELRRLLNTPTPGYNPTLELLDSGQVFNPVHNAADGKLYFGDGQRIYSATRKGASWVVTDTIRFAGAGDAPLTLFGFFAGGHRMLLGSAGDIWIAEPDGDQWRITDIPPYPVNTDYVETDAYMLPDGSGLLLASDRPGGVNLQPSGAYFHGDTALASDLWFIPRTGHHWGTPINLGLKVNTIYSERSPVLSRNLRTLYFVSDGHTGLGYGDIYMVERDDPSDWTSWGVAQNLGREVNGGWRENMLSLSPDERRLYFASNRSGRFAAYSVATTHNTAGANRTYTLNVDDSRQSLLRLQLADLESQTVTQQIDYLGDTGALSLTMRHDRRYALLADAGNSFVTATVVDPELMNVYRLPAYTYADLVAMDRPLPLPVVDFSDDENGEIVLLPVAQMQLDQLARFLRAHTGAVVELVVDVAGSDARRCYNLAMRRGEAVRNFLASRGVPAGNLLLSPYGNARTGLAGRSGVAIRFREREKRQ